MQFHNLGFPHFSQRQTEQQQQKHIPQSSGVTWHEAGVISSSIRQSETTCVLQLTSVQMRGWIPTAKDHSAFHLKLNQQSTVPLRLCCFANPYNTHQGSMTVGDKGKDAYS